jgi:hypothetical protein
LWEIGLFSNKWSLLAAAITIAIAFLAIYVLPVGMTPVSSDLFGTLFTFGLLPPIVEEVVKLILKFVRKSGLAQAPVPELAKVEG